MRLPVLDLYVLSLIERGLDTAYLFQREAGLSLGASTPALRRLSAARLVKRKEEESPTKRPRHAYSLTLSGRELAQNGWRDHFQAGRTPSDLDAMLRLADMAAHYGASPGDVAKFLRAASARTSALAQQAAAAFEESNGLLYPRMRSRCEAARLLAEAEVLSELAAGHSRVKAKIKPPASRQSSAVPRSSQKRTRR